MKTSRNDVTEEVRLFYLEKKLPADKVGALKRTISRRFSVPWALVATAILVALVLGLLLGHRSAWSTTDPGRFIAEEIAYHHFYDLPRELPLSDFREVSKVFSGLASFLSPSLVDELSARFHLKGGRYCSLAGKPAVQLRVEEKRRHEQGTLYLAAAEGFVEDAIGDYESDEVAVTLWRNGDRFLGLAVDRRLR